MKKIRAKKSLTDPIVVTLKDLIEGRVSCELNMFVNASPDLVACADKNRKLSYLNLAGRKMLGLSKDCDISQIDVLTFHPKRYHEFLQKEVLSKCLKGEIWQGNTVCCTISGNEFPVSAVVFCMNLHEEDFYIGTIVRDISKEKTVRHDLNTFQFIAESAPGAIITTDANGNIAFVNKRFEQMFGYSRREIIGSSPKILISDEDDKKSHQEVFKALHEGKKWFGEIAHCRKDGTQFYTEAYVFPVHGDNEIICWASVHYDISERRKQEIELAVARNLLEVRIEERTKKLKESEDMLQAQKLELEKKNLALQEVIAQIEIEKNRIKADVLANVEHLVRTDLSRIKKKKGSYDIKNIELLEMNLKRLTASFTSELKRDHYNLTPRELEICGLIKNGLSTKDMAELLNLSSKSVELHRTNIRKKLGFTNKKVNLAAYLLTL